MAMWKGKHFHTVLTEQSKCSKDIKMNNIILVYLRVVWLWPFDLIITRGLGHLLLKGYNRSNNKFSTYQRRALHEDIRSTIYLSITRVVDLWPFHIQSCWPLTLKSNWVTYSLKSLTLIGLLDIDWASLGLLVINVWRSLTYDLVTLKYMYIGVIDGTTVQSVDYT